MFAARRQYEIWRRRLHVQRRPAELNLLPQDLEAGEGQVEGLGARALVQVPHPDCGRLVVGDDESLVAVQAHVADAGAVAHQRGRGTGGDHGVPQTHGLVVAAGGKQLLEAVRGLERKINRS